MELEAAAEKKTSTASVAARVTLSAAEAALKPLQSKLEYAQRVFDAEHQQLIAYQNELRQLQNALDDVLLKEARLEHEVSLAADT